MTSVLLIDKIEDMKDRKLKLQLTWVDGDGHRFLKDEKRRLDTASSGTSTTPWVMRSEHGAGECLL